MPPKFDPAMEGRIQEALKALEYDPGLKITRAAELFNVPRQRLYQRLRGRGTLVDRATNNAKLDWAQETALVTYVERLDRMSLRVRQEVLRDAANLLLREGAGPDCKKPPELGVNWPYRFAKRHGFQVVKSKLRKTMDDHGIQPEDIWNMDETGFQIGVGKDTFVITRRRREHYFAIPTNRESATAVEAVSAGGEVIPAFLILSGLTHMSRWYDVEGMNGDTLVGDVRQQAFKTTTIHSSFTETGIHPFNPRKVLDKIALRRGSSSPPKTPVHQQDVLSSPFGTPTTYHKVNRVAVNIQRSAEKLLATHTEMHEELEAFVVGLNRFTRGALVQAAQLVQTQRDLGLTRLADQVRRALQQAVSTRAEILGQEHPSTLTSMANL
ncbi:fot5 transposase, partial [Colletotrichum musicola]